MALLGVFQVKVLAGVLAGFILGLTTGTLVAGVSPMRSDQAGDRTKVKSYLTWSTLGECEMTRTRYYVGLVDRNGKGVSAETRMTLPSVAAGAYGGGCTIFHASGYWQGCREPSLVIEAIGDDVDSATLAKHLAVLANQTSVLWTQEQVEGGFTS